jgi:predicted RNase H-like HicB family nuclease
MTFPVRVEPCEGQFAAAVVGAPEVRGVGPSRDEAVAALKSQIAGRIAEGELFSVEVDAPGVSRLAGKYADDPTLRDICSEIYERRDAEVRG